MPPDLRSVVSTRVGDLRRVVLRRRRPLAALLTGVAVLAVASVATEEPPDAVPVAVAAHDLPAGATITRADLTTAAFIPDSVPARLSPDAVGRVLAAPLTRGEPVTEVRLVGEAMTDGRPDLRAVPVRLPDAGTVALLRVGDVVDVLGADPQTASATVVARGATVVALPPADDVTGPTGLPGRLVVLGVAPDEVAGLADAASRTVVTYAWSKR